MSTTSFVLRVSAHNPRDVPAGSVSVFLQEQNLKFTKRPFSDETAEPEGERGLREERNGERSCPSHCLCFFFCADKTMGDLTLPRCDSRPDSPALVKGPGVK